MFVSHLYRKLLFCFFVVLQIFEHLRNINDNRCSYWIVKIISLMHVSMRRLFTIP